MKIVLGVCGSISAYKAYELLRLLVKDGHQVKIVLTQGAAKFVSSFTFSSLGAEQVFSHGDDFNQSAAQGSVLHVELNKWMDRLIIAPASANTISHLAYGRCPDLLTSIALCTVDKPMLIFPAMNTSMLLNKITQYNFELLSKLAYIHGTASGELACGDIGEGKLVPIEEIFYTVITYHAQTSKKILITTGATIAPVDSIRYLTNPASGKTGVEIALEALKNGYSVQLLCGSHMNNTYLGHVPHLEIIVTATNEDMYLAAKNLFSECDAYISAAAVTDIKFKTSDTKLKKGSLTGVLEYEVDTDILKSLAQSKKNQILIGFAAEDQLNKEQLTNKMKSKNMDLLIGNIARMKTSLSHAQGFQQDSNIYAIIDKKSYQEKQLSKSELAKLIMEFLCQE